MLNFNQHINVHVPHHISTAIPAYNLRKAHEIIQENWGEYVKERQFNWDLILEITDNCHLYDQENCCQTFDDFHWYLAHLVAWICVFISLALHLLMGAKVGGVPLLVSMFNWTTRSEDTPLSWLQEVKIKHSSLVLKVLESIVIGGIILAFLLPVFNS